jgi:DNA polymerase-3 subunit gamma/tau
MAHRALTLKYRPQVFADMVGQDHVSTVIMRAIEGNRVAHAYLFTGARGVGKTTSARILAKALNCERRAAGKTKTADPCNECTSCTEITSGVSLDVAEIDGASNRGIADVQALRERVRFSPTGGRYRVVIIDEVHQLSNDAFAALLKTLEEPPPHLVFVFATTDPQKLPETIRSRCQRFDFARVPLRKIVERLFDLHKREATDPEGARFKLSEGAAFLIARASEGSMRDAVSALDQVVSAGETDVSEDLVRRVLGIPDRESFFAIAGAIVAHDAAGALKALHAAFEKGIDARELAEGLAEHIRHLLVLKVDPEGEDLVAASHEDLARLREQAAGWSEGDLLRLLKLISETPWVIRDSPQPLVHLEAAVMQMASLEPGETLAAILERLEQLERKLGGAGSPPRPPTPERSTSGPARRAAPERTTSGAIAAPPATPPRSYSAPGPRAQHTEPVAPANVPATMESAAEIGTAVLEPETEVMIASDAAAQWAKVIQRINGRKRMLGAFLEESRFGGVIGAEIQLETDDLHAAVIDEKENRALVHEAIRHVFGAQANFRCVRPGRPVARPITTNADVQPMIEQAIRFFDGEPIEPEAPRAETPRSGQRSFRKERASG